MTDREPARIPISIRVLPKTLETFRATGPGWQQRMNGALDYEAYMIRERARRVARKQEMARTYQERKRAGLVVPLKKADRKRGA